MTQKALRFALEALDNLMYWDNGKSEYDEARDAIIAIKEALAQPEFIKHEVENADDWSEWVCPDPKGYLMKCCDCGLVHEAEFRIVRYKSETEREDCDIVDDPNLQAVFRMRRSEQWLPEDTAHRAGGLPMAQPEQEPVAWSYWQSCLNDDGTQTAPWVHRLSKFKPTESIINKDVMPLYTTPSQRTWVGLTDEDWDEIFGNALTIGEAIKVTEAKLKEKNTRQDGDCKHCVNGCPACDARRQA